ncbi:hypothetical protein Sulku_0094 [Sulfuricurvum kujiense DSM 16994]|uniref:Helix-turn-helix domain-containing protein n=1 Tax=Sulfuricurvum kujiense (strain ATCC BAA-921 / DSM 16994 / JCM 11577 / YK-1) TaxID=709032 RepID=E4TWT1_SULKY|nr:helix-turn-helix domain-containing protein [Sulfuricurvum kujiense]ADR32762.1 hypothetical protein Sulku_0094 [Sulfuricurvum kujiense DSM 16994]
MASIELITKEDFDELKALIIGAVRPLMTVEEAGEYLRLSPHTIRHKIADQTFILGVHYSDKAGKILFAKERLDTWLWEESKESNNVSIQKKQSGVDRLIRQWSESQEIHGTGVDCKQRQKGRKRPHSPIKNGDNDGAGNTQKRAS